jgi:hypothetical protein
VGSKVSSQIAKIAITCETVTQKTLDDSPLMYYIINMANVLGFDKQVTIIGSLAEGSSIRSIERMTGVHRDTIMRFGVKVGQGCVKIHDGIMRDLPCTRATLHRWPRGVR